MNVQTKRVSAKPIAAKAAPPRTPPVLSINIHSTVAVYVQIENLILMRLMGGTMKPGDQLPSVKAASDMMNVNFNTVAKAYRDLETMGVVYTRRGMGCYITPEGPAKAKARMGGYIDRKLSEAVREAREAKVPLNTITEQVRRAYSGNGAVY